MAFTAGDKTLQGGPPVAGSYVQGMLHLHVYALQTDATGKTIGVDAYSFTPPNYIDWGDGTRGTATAFVAGAVPPAGQPRVYTAQRVYPVERTGIQRGYVENGVRARFDVYVGKPRIIDPELRDKTVPELEREARARDLQDARQTMRWREGQVS